VRIFVADWLFDYLRMLINIDEAKLRTVAQLQAFLDATQAITLTVAPAEGGQQRCAQQARQPYSALCTQTNRR
jgi:polysaccharide deacetylase 2 family uncharacterized protein YibQ